MPKGGSKPGERRGGRQVGTKNIRTLEKNLIKEAVVKELTNDARRREESLRRIEAQAEQAAQVVQTLHAQGKPLAKDALGLFLEIFMGRAAYYQPRPQQQKDAQGRLMFDARGRPILAEQNESASEVNFEKWARLSVDCAKALAPYQSPTYRAIMVAPPPPSAGEEVRRFTLTVVDRKNGQAVRAEINGSGGGNGRGLHPAVIDAAVEDDDEN